MKFIFSAEFSIVVILFIGIMFISTCGSTKITPYEKSYNTLQMYPYSEGMESKMDDKSGGDMSAFIDKALKNKPSADSLPVDNFPSPPNEGFDTLKLNGSRYGAESLSDPISQLSSSPSCVGQSSGLSNSTGGLCFSPQMVQLLKTRGNNANSQPSQIGA